MKGTALFSVMLVTAWQTVQAEPVFMPQAQSVMQAKQGEAGVGAQFGYQKSEIETAPGTTFTNRVAHIPLFARYGVTDAVETRLVVPITRAIDSSEGLASSHKSDTGLGNIQMGAKWNFLKAMFPLAAALDLDLPTANSKNNPASLGWRYSNQIQQGFNTHLQLIADTPKLQDMLEGHAEIGYMNTATYTTSADTRFNPSDLFTFGASVDLSLKRWVNNLSVSGEMVGNTALNHSKTNGNTNGNDKGAVLEAGPAVRYQMGPVRTYAGVLFDAGNATFRAYNTRVNLGVSMLWGTH
jgi:opacity protein-like surface antigen